MSNTIETQHVEIRTRISEHVDRLRDDALMVQYPEHIETALWFIEYEVRQIRALLATRE